MKRKDYYSGKQVTKAGECFLKVPPIDSDEFDEAMNVLNFWRKQHQIPLDIAFTKLQKTVLKIENDPIFGKRIKRWISIVRKLIINKENRMALRNMRDIGGCRAIVSSSKKLKKTIRIVKTWPECQFKEGHRYRVNDYTKNSKPDGYRSFHIYGSFGNKNSKNRYIEIQLRTKIQHYWATSLEIIEIFTNKAFRENKGNNQWNEFFVKISDIFYIMDNIPTYEKLDFQLKKRALVENIISNKIARSLCKDVQKLCKTLDVVKLYDGYANSLEFIGPKANIPDEFEYALIIIDVNKHLMKKRFFHRSEREKANSEYTTEETLNSGDTNIVVSLISTSTLGNLKEAYPNYFADSAKFLQLLRVITEIKV